MKSLKRISLALSIIILISSFSQIYATEIELESISNILFKDSVKRSTYNELLTVNSELEKAYNLKGNIPIRVKDQKKSGSCWAFAFSSLLETSMAKQHNKTIETLKEYSPMHIEYVTTQMFNRTLGSGAGSRLSVAYSTSGHGPVEESQMPFESVYNSQTERLKPISEVGSLDKPVVVKVKDTREFSKITKNIENGIFKYTVDTSFGTSFDLDGEENIVEANRKLIKEHIKTYGAISADIYMDTANYYNPTTAAYNCNNYESDLEPNHVVTIVGWDDNYEISSFKDGTKPTSKGAYIALNSYGTEWGKDGYVYISYEDAFIEQKLMGITNVEEFENNKKDYDKIYQHDEAGMNMGIRLSKQTNSYVGSKYTREALADKDEYINEVGIYIAATSGVEVYVNEENDDLDSAKLVSNAGILETGYHTIKFNPVKLTGNKFAIKVKYTNQEGAAIPLSVNLKKYYEGYSEDEKPNVSNFFDNLTSEPDQSYILINNNGADVWADLTKLKTNGGKSNFEGSSTCVKAFTTYQEKNVETVAVTGVNLDKTTSTIKAGATDTLIATVVPANATNKNVTWTSSNTSVATINNGVVTGVKAGTATITATTEDGSKTASCTVTVEESAVPETVAVTGVTLNKETSTIKAGTTDTLTATVVPANATNKNVTWTSSNTSVATVKNGVITGVAEGTASITVTTNDGAHSASCEVIVEKALDSTIAVESIKIDKTTYSIQVGDKTTLVATVTPTNATNKKITWTSSDASVATISEAGIVTALKEGKTTITATAEDGNKTATSTVTVTKKTNTADDIYKDDSGSKNTLGTTINAKTADTTVVNKILPYAGKATLIAIGIAVTVAIIIFIRYIKFKDID